MPVCTQAFSLFVATKHRLRGRLPLAPIHSVWREVDEALRACTVDGRAEANQATHIAPPDIDLAANVLLYIGCSVCFQEMHIDCCICSAKCTKSFGPRDRCLRCCTFSLSQRYLHCTSALVDLALDKSICHAGIRQACCCWRSIQLPMQAWGRKGTASL